MGMDVAEALDIDIEQALIDSIAEARWPTTRVAFVAGVSEQGAQKWLDRRSRIGGAPLLRLMRALPNLRARLLDGIAA